MNIKGRKRYNEDQIDITISGNKIEKVNNFKYLGIIIDNKLNWNDHVKNVVKNIQKLIPIFYNIRNFTHQKVCIQLYKSVVISKINYGLEIYGNRDLTKIQNCADKILEIISFNKNNNDIQKLKRENKIMQIVDNKNLLWIKLSRDIIYNSINLPYYFKKLIEIKDSRNGLIKSTTYRKSKYGDKLSYNIMETLWNKLDINTRKIQEILFFNENITNYYLYK